MKVSERPVPDVIDSTGSHNSFRFAHIRGPGSELLNCVAWNNSDLNGESNFRDGQSSGGNDFFS